MLLVRQIFVLVICNPFLLFFYIFLLILLFYFLVLMNFQFALLLQVLETHLLRLMLLNNFDIVLAFVSQPLTFLPLLLLLNSFDSF
ncbi:MAG: hypothetical protein EBR82_50205 [Caulobacteraceae bacterium]|nr:hypothetical protein [Caulobacteraceae bacterium]